MQQRVRAAMGRAGETLNVHCSSSFSSRISWLSSMLTFLRGVMSRYRLLTGVGSLLPDGFTCPSCVGSPGSVAPSAATVAASSAPLRIRTAASPLPPRSASRSSTILPARLRLNVRRGRRQGGDDRARSRSDGWSSGGRCNPSPSPSPAPVKQPRHASWGRAGLPGVCSRSRLLCVAAMPTAACQLQARTRASHLPLVDVLVTAPSRLLASHRTRLREPSATWRYCVDELW
eukprot:763136-Hanusia_phi.AAC.3